MPHVNRNAPDPDAVRSWLAAKFLERSQRHNIQRVYTAKGEREATPQESVFASIPCAEMHEYLLSIGVNLQQALADCERAGWIRLADLHGTATRHYHILPAVRGKTSEGDKPLDAATPTVLSTAPMSASELAAVLKQDAKRVGKFLERFRRTNRDCCVEVQNRRANEAQYRYYPDKVFPALQKHFATNG